MSIILTIESTSKICSVAISKDSEILAIRETTENNHSSVLTEFVIEVIKEAGLTTKDMDAVAVSKGPGSYTGLRIGVSAAKGLCYALDIPLIAVDTLYSLALQAHKRHPSCMICPMADARRMEVYAALYDSDMSTIIDVEAKVIDTDSYSEYLKDNKIVFLGSGSSKVSEIIKSENALFDYSIDLSSSNLVTVAEERFTNSEFEDIAYFEPYYLKEFVAKKPVVKALKKE